MKTSIDGDFQSHVWWPLSGAGPVPVRRGRRTQVDFGLEPRDAGTICQDGKRLETWQNMGLSENRVYSQL